MSGPTVLDTTAPDTGSAGGPAVGSGTGEWASGTGGVGEARSMCLLLIFKLCFSGLP